MNVAVIGSGSIGPDLAYGFLTAIARSGGTVLLHDIRKEALDAGVARIEKYMEKALARGKLSQKDVRAMRERLVPTLEVERLSGCAYVLEAATEHLETKRAILKTLERVVSPDCLIGFATSGLPRGADRGWRRAPRALLREPPLLPGVALAPDGGGALRRRRARRAHGRASCASSGRCPSSPPTSPASPRTTSS